MPGKQWCDARQARTHNGRHLHKVVQQYPVEQRLIAVLHVTKLVIRCLQRCICLTSGGNPDYDSRSTGYDGRGHLELLQQPPPPDMLGCHTSVRDMLGVNERLPKLVVVHEAIDLWRSVQFAPQPLLVGAHERVAAICTWACMSSTLIGSSPRRPSLSLSELGNAVPCEGMHD